VGSNNDDSSFGRTRRWLYRHLWFDCHGSTWTGPVNASYASGGPRWSCHKVSIPLDHSWRDAVQRCRLGGRLPYFQSAL